MRIALTKYGMPQVVVFAAIVSAGMGLVLLAGLTVSNVCVRLRSPASPKATPRQVKLRRDRGQAGNR